MIAIGDIRSDGIKGAIKFGANLDPIMINENAAPLHYQVPSNRHNYRTDILFADGHCESPKRNDVIDPTSITWRARWNNDNDPHTADVSAWTVSNVNGLEQ